MDFNAVYHRVKTDFAASGNRMKLSVRNTIYDAAGKIVAKSKGGYGFC